MDNDYTIVETKFMSTAFTPKCCVHSLEEMFESIFLSARTVTIGCTIECLFCYNKFELTPRKYWIQVPKENQA